MRSVPTTWVTGPKGVVSVHKWTSDEYAVTDPSAESVLFTAPKRPPALKWAKAYVGEPCTVKVV